MIAAYNHSVLTRLPSHLRLSNRDYETSDTGMVQRSCRQGFSRNSPTDFCSVFVRTLSFFDFVVMVRMPE